MRKDFNCFWPQRNVSCMSGIFSSLSLHVSQNSYTISLIVFFNCKTTLYLAVEKNKFSTLDTWGLPAFILFNCLFSWYDFARHLGCSLGCKYSSNSCFRFCYFFPSYLTPVFIPYIDLVYRDFVHTWARLSWLSRHLLKKKSGWPVGDRLPLNVQPVNINTKQRISSLISRSHSVVDFLRQGDG